jgi:C1A family cysteine protease
MQRRYGWIPDPPKAKDYSARAHGRLDRVLAGALPPKASNRDLILNILDQGQLGACTANAVAQAVRAAMVRMSVVNPRLLARLFPYFYARSENGGDVTQDSGTWLRAIFDVLSKLGFTAEEFWPYSDSTTGNPPPFATAPPADVLRRAYDQRGNIGYYKITSTGDQRIDDVKTAIANRYCVAFGTIVGSAFESYQAGGSPLPPPADQLGGHALCAAEYDETGSIPYFNIVNSWGALFGNAGWAPFTYDYITWSQTSDLWIVETAPVFSDA